MTPSAPPPLRRTRWSRRRHRLLGGLGAAVVVLGSGAFVLPAQYGVTTGLLAGLCAFLMVAALVVFLVVPGPGTVATLARSSSLAGSALVVCVLLVLSTQGQALQWLWWLGTVLAAAWTAGAVSWTRRSGR